MINISNKWNKILFFNTVILQYPNMVNWDGALLIFCLVTWSYCKLIYKRFTVKKYHYSQKLMDFEIKLFFIIIRILLFKILSAAVRIQECAIIFLILLINDCFFYVEHHNFLYTLRLVSTFSSVLGTEGTRGEGI